MEDQEIRKIIVGKGFKIKKNEEFKQCVPVKFERYFISNQGRCFSTISMKFLKPAISGIIKKNFLKRDGYKFVSLQTVDHKSKLMYIHRLIVMAFYPDENFRLWVNHKNKDRLDNNLINLEFVPPKKNIELGIAIAIKARNINTDEEINFISIAAASRFLDFTYCSIYNALSRSQLVNNYKFIKI